MLAHSRAHAHVRVFVPIRWQFEEVANKDDLMGADDTRGRTSFFSSRPSTQKRATVFTLGDRASILSELEAPILVPHMKEGGKELRFPYEKLFRSMQYALMDNCAREFVFCMVFFCMPENRAVKLFHDVMGKTMAHILKHEETRIATCFDSISLVLCARIVKEYQKSLEAQGIACIEPYYKKLLGFIWPRFAHIVSLNTASIGQLDPSKLPKSQPLQPHYIVRRYAEYSGALLVLNEGADFTEVTDALDELRLEVANFLLRMAALFSSRKDQLIFLINNYDMMISVYSERTSSISPELEDFRQLLQARIQEYAVEELGSSFGAMIAFVKKTDRDLSKASDPSELRVDESQIKGILASFAQNWKEAIRKMQENLIAGKFSNFKNGTAILHEALKQLLVVYERFCNMLKQPPFRRGGGWGPDMIDKHTVMVEVKKYKSMF
jgi:hypothetical protein